MKTVNSVLRLLITTTALAVSPIKSLTYTIVPNNTSIHNSKSSEFENKTSFTLQQLADHSLLNDSNLYLHENLTLIFGLGRHYLVGGIELNKIRNVFIRGQLGQVNQPEIICKEKSCFSFLNTSSILIENLTFTKCFKKNYLFHNDSLKSEAENSSQNGVGAGVITVLGGILNITGCVFKRNRGIFGGVLFVFSTFVHFRNNLFINNRAIEGGALYISFGSIIFENDQFVGNEAESVGGAITAYNTRVSSSYCEFSNNRATGAGGAFLLFNGTLESFESLYKSNSASQNGGALLVFHSLININGDCFHNNTGGGKISNNTESFSNNGYSNIQAGKNDPINTNIIQLTNVCGNYSNLTFSNNIGSVYLFDSKVDFSGSTIFTGNSALTGGALTLVQSTVTFEEFSKIHIEGNNATYGGGIFLTRSDLKVCTSLLRIENNRATEFGGGIYGYESDITINTSILVLLTSNSAAQGGAVFVIASSISVVHGSVLFTTNKASKGGAIALSEGSKILIKKATEEIGDDIKINMTFSNNSADYGGALHVDDNSNSIALCDQSTRIIVPSTTTKECFIQTLRFYFPRYPRFNDYNYINVFFSSNTANKLGKDIFGGLLDRCHINAFAEIHNLKIAEHTNGIAYLQAIAQFQVEIDYNKMINHYSLTSNNKTITKEHIKDLIASDPIQLCFCVNRTYNCSHQWPQIFIQRGQPFNIRAVTVDQIENPVNGTVMATALSRGTRLKADQMKQLTFGICTDLTYNVFSTELNTTFALNADGPCGKAIASSQKINVIFTECDCPGGFQQALLDDECKCECGDSLDALIRNCQLNHNDNIATIVRKTEDYWIQYVVIDSQNLTGLQVQACPYDYCVDEPANLSISLPLNVDKQCAYNRTGIMCGECEEGLSLVFGSSKCAQCSNNYLALLIAFAIAGIALIAFILILNMTVAIGTIHGLILYTNIVGANSHVFLPSETAPRLFVSWLNLDLGIETCFYDGMNVYGKVLLQLVFPAYIIFLSILIMVVSHCWGWFGKLIGRKNPVSTFGTLYYLSYSKIRRIIIVSLQFTHLSFPDGSNNILWLYNPNIPYFTASRIPFFMLSIIIVAFDAFQLVLLFLEQKSVRIKKLIRITQGSNYGNFSDAYRAPFVSKHCNWLGILLLITIVHHLLSAILNEITLLLVVSCLMCALLTLKQITGEVYKNRLIGLLETSYLVNLLLFSVGTYHVTVVNGDQVALANTSVSIAFITFIGVVLYHTHTYILKSFKTYLKLVAAVKKCFKCLKQKRAALRVSTTNSQNMDTAVTSMQMDDVLREPALDIIAPVTKQDYSKPDTPSVVSKPATSTVVCIEDSIHGSLYNI